MYKRQVHASCGEHFVDVFERTHFAFDRNVLAFCLEIGFGIQFAKEEKKISPEYSVNAGLMKKISGS